MKNFIKRIKVSDGESVQQAVDASTRTYTPEYKQTLMQMQGGEMKKSLAAESKKPEENKDDSSMSSMCAMKDKLKEMAMKEIKAEILEEIVVKELTKKAEKKITESLVHKLFDK